MKNIRIGIVASRFYEGIAEKLLQGARGALRKAGVSDGQIAVVVVPGTFEIPLAAKKLVSGKKVDAVVALGCVIRGETIHFEVICKTTLASLQRLSLETGIPVTSGILMVENEEQAYARAGGDAGNRGEEAALAALEMLKALKGAEG